MAILITSGGQVITGTEGLMTFAFQVVTGKPRYHLAGNDTIAGISQPFLGPKRCWRLRRRRCRQHQLTISGSTQSASNAIIRRCWS